MLLTYIGTSSRWVVVVVAAAALLFHIHLSVMVPTPHKKKRDRDLQKKRRQKTCGLTPHYIVAYPYYTNKHFREGGGDAREKKEKAHHPPTAARAMEGGSKRAQETVTQPQPHGACWCSSNLQFLIS